MEYLESTSRKLGEFLDKVRAVEAPLSRCEERLEAALGAPPAAARDAVARLLDHVHGLRAPLQVKHHLFFIVFSFMICKVDRNIIVLEYTEYLTECFHPNSRC